MPEHMTRMILTLAGYCILAVPARSAAAYEHQLQQKVIIFGSKLISDSFIYSGLRSYQIVRAASIWLLICSMVNP